MLILFFLKFKRNNNDLFLWRRNSFPNPDQCSKCVQGVLLLLSNALRALYWYQLFWSWRYLGKYFYSWEVTEVSNTQLQRYQTVSEFSFAKCLGVLMRVAIICGTTRGLILFNRHINTFLVNTHQYLCNQFHCVLKLPSTHLHRQKR